MTDSNIRMEGDNTFDNITIKKEKSFGLCWRCGCKEGSDGSSCECECHDLVY